MLHPRYAGQVVDAHCHFDLSTVAHIRRALGAGRIDAALHLWDLSWPPRPFEKDAATWDDEYAHLGRAHVPDLSGIGTPGNERLLETQIQRAAARGAQAVKIWKNLGLWIRDRSRRRVRADDPRLEVLWHVAAELQLPVMIHQGEPQAFFEPMTDDNPRIAELRSNPSLWLGGDTYPPLGQIHAELEALVAGNPATTFVAVHFGSFMTASEVARMFASYPNYHVDTAAAIADMGAEHNYEAAREIIINNEDRVLFGTDLIRTATIDLPAPQTPAARWALREFFARHYRFFETGLSGLAHPLPVQGAWTVTGLDLPEATLGKLYVGNSRRLFAFTHRLGLDPGLALLACTARRRSTRMTCP
jgi:Amidohydrolase